MADSLVSIIIPVFNRAHLISQTLDAVLHQSYKHWECIVVDDGSLDNTTSIVKAYCDKDDRFKLKIRSKELEKGGNVCRNLGFKLSEGAYIQWLDSDDLLGVNKLKLQVEALQKEIDTSIAICKFGYFTDSKDLSIRYKVKTYKDYRKGLYLLKAFGNHAEFFPPHVFLTKRHVAENAGLWDENLEINQDGEYFTRVLLEASKVKFVDANVYYRKSTNDNVSLVSSPRKAQSLINCWKLINNHITEFTGKKTHIYVETAKSTIYKQIKDSYPEIVEKNKSFFNSNSTSMFNRIFNIK